MLVPALPGLWPRNGAAAQHRDRRAPRRAPRCSCRLMASDPAASNSLPRGHEEQQQQGRPSPLPRLQLSHQAPAC